METVKIGYFSLKVNLKDAQMVNELVSAVGIKGDVIRPYEMHVTLMFDKTNPIDTRTASFINRNQAIYDAVITGFDFLGGDSVVLLLSSPEVENRHKELKIFMTHSFEDFLPHTSVAYNADEEDFEKLKSVLTGLVGTSIVLYGESFATIKE